MQETRISLYLDLEEGRTADLEVVAQAALAWNAMIKTYAAAVAPELGEVRVDWFDATASSARLNNLLKATVAGDPKALAALAGGIILFFAMGPAIHLQEDFGQDLLGMFGHKDYAELSPETIDEIANKAADKVLLEQADEQRRRVVRQSARDQNVKGVGATLRRTGKPALIIPRSEFHALGDIERQKPQSLIQSRADLDMPVTLLRANLREDGEGVWRFWNNDIGEFSAKIGDDEFSEALRAKHTGIELGYGIQMRVDLVTRDELIDGIWKVKDRTVKRVNSPPIQRRQQGLRM